MELSLNTATVRKQWNLAQIIDGCARHGIRGISPWRDQVAADGFAGSAESIKDKQPDRHRPVPRRVLRREELAGRQPARHRGGARARRAGAGPGGGRDAARDRRTWLRSRKQIRDCIAEHPARSAQGGRAARDRAAASDAGAARRASTRSSRRSTCATRWARVSAWRSTSTTCGGTRSSQSQIDARRASASSATTSATGCRATRDLFNDRGMMGDGVIDLPLIRSWVEAAGYTRLPGGRDLLRARLVEARSGRSAAVPARKGSPNARRRVPRQPQGRTAQVSRSRRRARARW